MKKRSLLIATACVLGFANICYSQTQGPLTPDEERQILQRLNNNVLYRELTQELQLMLRDYAAEVQLRERRIQEERGQLLNEKKARLSALIALQEYRTTRRPLIVKIFTLGIVGDKHDKQLEVEIETLRAEILNWK